MSTKPGYATDGRTNQWRFWGCAMPAQAVKRMILTPGRDSTEHRYVASRIRRIGSAYQLRVRRPNLGAHLFSARRAHRPRRRCLSFCSVTQGLSVPAPSRNPRHVPFRVLLRTSEVLANARLFARGSGTPPASGRRARGPQATPMLSEYTLFTSLLRRHPVGPCAPTEGFAVDSGSTPCCCRARKSPCSCAIALGRLGSPDV